MIAFLSFPVCLPGNQLDGPTDVGGDLLPGGFAPFWVYLKLVVEWVVQISVLFKGVDLKVLV